MNLSKVGLILAGVLLAAGMGSANLLDSFGVISGEADVEGPTFWTDSGSSIVLDDPGSSYGGSLEGKDLNTWEFEGLNGEDWYELQADLFLRARLTDDSDVESADIAMEFRPFDDNGDLLKSEVCKDLITIEKDDDLQNEDGSCEADYSDIGVHEFDIKIESSNSDADVSFSQGSDTRVEVNAQ